MKVNFRLFLLLEVLSLAGFCLMAVSVLFINIDPFATAREKINVLPGILFWVGLATGVGAQLGLRLGPGKAVRGGRIGLIRFFSNPFGAAADVLLVVSTVGTAVVLFVDNGLGKVLQIFLSLLLFSFPAHCVLNGRKFHYIYKIHRQKTKRSVRNEKSV